MSVTLGILLGYNHICPAPNVASLLAETGRVTSMAITIWHLWFYR